jgi:hypothetical protein
MAEVIRIDAEPRVIVEPTTFGAFAVSLKPFFSCPDIERAYPRAWEALEYAEMLNLEFGWRVIDRTGERA